MEPNSRFCAQRTDGEIFWFANHIRPVGISKVDRATLELETPDIHPGMMDISKEDVARAMHNYESHVSFTR